MSEQLPDRVDPILDHIREIDPGRDVAMKAVVIRLRRAAHYVDTEVRRRLGPNGMEWWELELLTTLNRRGGQLAMGQLQDAFQLTSGAITNRISRLETNGYVERTIDAHDRRLVRVSLTRAGAERARELVAANDEVEEELFGHLDRALLGRLAEDLRGFLVGTEGPPPKD